MRTLIISAILTSACITVLAQTKEYVCMPCGGTCDAVVHTQPGSCPSCRMKLVDKSALRFENLTVAEFCSRIANNAEGILLDVRSKGEFEGSGRNTYGHFRNAININVEDLEGRISELAKYMDREVLVYCSHSIRSPRAAMMLTENGFLNVKNMSGGVSTLRVQGDECLEKNFVVH